MCELILLADFGELQICRRGRAGLREHFTGFLDADCQSLESEGSLLDWRTLTIIGQATFGKRGIIFLARDFSFPRVATITGRFMPHTSNAFSLERKHKMIANRICALWPRPDWLIANRGHKKRSKIFGRRNPQIPQTGRLDAGEAGRTD